MIHIRGIYGPNADAEGFRILVDRIWPRGITKETAQLDGWLPEIAPSEQLRRWYSDEPSRWPEFARRYEAELTDTGRAKALARLADQAEAGSVTLLCAAVYIEHSTAAVLANVINERLAHHEPPVWLQRFLSDARIEARITPAAS